jgi:DNA-binding GntR family transcriptional regulator
MKQTQNGNLSGTVYTQLKNDIFEFRLLPGDRFTETEIAERTGVSRTPVREALFRLAREGHIEVVTRNGWHVKPLDFALFDHLYDVRVVLEAAAVDKICKLQQPPLLDELRAIWLVPQADRLNDGTVVARLDEDFHETLIKATGNPEMSRIFHDITERIRIIRRLDFTQSERIHQTYEEHARILRHIGARQTEQATLLLKAHIEISKAEVKKITLHRLYEARTQQA